MSAAMGQTSPTAAAADVRPSAEHCSKPTPEDIAWDTSLPVEERERRLQDWHHALSAQLCGPHNPRLWAEMERVFEALHVLSAMRRAEDDWDHFPRPAAFH